MANRAYLFVSDSEDCDCCMIDQYPEDWYYDSRWCIPLAWFFFFDPADVRLVPVQGWYEVRLVAAKDQAVARFDRREPYLRTLVGASVDWILVMGLRNDIAGMEGRNLLLNPNEVLGGISLDDEEHAGRIRTILAELDRSPPLDPSIDELLEDYVLPRDGGPDRTLGQMIGFTYRHDGRDYGLPPGYFDRHPVVPDPPRLQ